MMKNYREAYLKKLGGKRMSSEVQTTIDVSPFTFVGLPHSCIDVRIFQIYPEFQIFYLPDYYFPDMVTVTLVVP